MRTYRLTLRQDNGVSASYPVPAKGLLIGRSPEMDIVLKGQLVSRKHVQISLEDGELRAKDLGSRNGIMVNGQQVVSARLHEGDRFRVGQAEFIVESDDEMPTSRSVISFERATHVYETILRESSSNRLSHLYKAAQLLSDGFDLDDLLSKLLSLIFEALPAKRGYILTVEENDEPVVRAKMSRPKGNQPPPLSRTVVDYVIRERSAILTTDAQEDNRFSDAPSVLDFSIHSAMCVPLCGHDSVVGAAYIDSGAEPDPFTEFDLELLTAIGLVAGVAVDNTRLYEMNLMKERLAAIGQATAGIGHCVKNVLTGIKGGAQIIDAAIEREDFDYLRRGWPLVKRSMERMETLMLNMLSFSKDRKPQLGIMDLNGTVEEALDMVASRAEKYGVEVSLEQGKLPVVQGDGRELFRVFLNLAHNAMDAMARDGGKLTVKTWIEGDICYVEFSDTGPGIDPKILPQLFQAFVSTKGSSGTGLGLACSRKIAREHGGDVTVRSTVGQGAVFLVSLPKTPPEET